MQTSKRPDHHIEWAPLTPADAVELLAGATMPWWVAGGWAIDLYLGQSTRAHVDMDIAIPRSCQSAMASALSGWDIHVATDGALTPWTRGDWLEGGCRHQFWARPNPKSRWMLELLLEEGSKEYWQFRRQPDVRLPWEQFGRRSTDGIPFVAPEVVLLFKAKNTVPKDLNDFESVLPILDSGQRHWLIAALNLVHPGHEWCDRLSKRS